MTIRIILIILGLTLFVTGLALSFDANNWILGPLLTIPGGGLIGYGLASVYYSK